MPDLYLDLSDQKELINFLSKWEDFASGKIKSHADSFITDYDDGKEIDSVELQNFTKEFAREVYPARYALKRFFGDHGAGVEWRMTEKALRRSTAHLMEKFRALPEVHTIDDLLDHEDFDLSFSAEDRSEMEQVRHHVWEDYWNNNKASLESYVDEGEAELEKFEKMIGQLREKAGELLTLLQEELYSKITKYEDRVLYYGEILDEDLLQQELEYYAAQSDMPIKNNQSKPAL
ncbi:hypothetical protein GF391_02735 [Candidatus Uhrbacteria bacterium]|nr:hypothetical protein [Candidatus Uhrbacteria bacterium]